MTLFKPSPRVAGILSAALLCAPLAAQGGSGEDRPHRSPPDQGRGLPSAPRSWTISSTSRDVYGPRITDSPNHRAAAEWIMKRLESYGPPECSS